MKFIHALIGVLAGLALAQTAYGWRETGHWVVCEIAYRQIENTPAGAAVRALTGNKDYARQCTWPDMVRKSAEWKHTYDWHFINVDEGNYLSPSHFSKTGDAMQAIMTARAVLKSNAPQAKKQQYLRFLGHMTGDLHQPLHAGHKSDLGGNNIALKWFGQPKFAALEILRFLNPDPTCPTNRFRDPQSGNCKACPTDAGHRVDSLTGECLELKTSNKEHNLHYIWDYHLIERFKEQEGIVPEDGDSPEAHRAYATWLLAHADSQRMAQWRTNAMFDWTRESLTDRGAAYDVEPGQNLGQAYYDANIQRVHDRLTAAGVRLGALLTEIFSGPATLQDAFVQVKHDEQHQHLCQLATAAGANDPIVCQNLP